MKKWVASWVLGLILAGCGGKTVCDQACDKLASCNLHLCDGNCDTCVASCIITAPSCAELIAGLGGTMNSVSTCIGRCQR